MAKANADAPRVTSVTGPVFMAEALERLLPQCENNPHRVAELLDNKHHRGEIRLLAGGVMVAPGSNPNMLGVAAHVLSDGKAVLYIQVRRGLAGDYPAWDGKDVESLKEHHRFWAFERDSFDALLSDAPAPDAPDQPRNLGGRLVDFDVEELLSEALIYVAVHELPKTVGGEGGLHEQLKLRLGSRCPERTRFAEIFGPIFQRIKAEQSR